MSKVFRSATTVSLFTLLSRILGLVRDMITASLFGAGLAFDAFVLAWRVPNLFRRLFGEGALSAAFIPVYSDYLEAKDPEDTAGFLNSIFGVLLVVLLAIAAAGAIAGAVLGFGASFSDKWQMSFRLFILLVPYVVPVCLVAFAAAVLNSHGHFAMPAFAPALLNVFWIASLAVAYFITRNLSVMVVVLGGGILLAGVMQFVVQIPVLRRKGIKLRVRPKFSHPGVRAVRKVMAPVVLGVAIIQVNTLLDSFIAMAFVKTEGGVSVLYYANRLVQFPLALVGIAVATAAFPTLSRLAAGGQKGKFALALKESLLGVLFVAVPAAVGLAVLAAPIVRLIFERGQFTASDTKRASFALVCYAATAAAASAYHIVTRAFYSLKDTRTPVTVGAVMVGLNLALNLTLVWPMQEAGLALATSISSVCNVVVLLLILRNKAPGLDIGSLAKGLMRFVFASAIMGSAVLGTLYLLPAADRLLLKVIAVVAPMITGVLVVFIVSALLRFPELAFMLKSLRRRRRA
jgi:putative peptidoglycan lipid II flippase